MWNELCLTLSWLNSSAHQALTLSTVCQSMPVCCKGQRMRFNFWENCTFYCFKPCCLYSDWHLHYCHTALEINCLESTAKFSHASIDYYCNLWWCWIMYYVIVVDQMRARMHVTYLGFAITILCVLYETSCRLYISHFLHIQILNKCESPMIKLKFVFYRSFHGLILIKLTL